ncbi:hypothetical protein GCM10010439_49440 [Actinocorallia aurantiaca]|uniref:Uncharacterized protein n=1 Tax=Actinocorallia aurantiaca TaxID=46204 RepID=A0ABP6H033_9ACTN
MPGAIVPGDGIPGWAGVTETEQGTPAQTAPAQTAPVQAEPERTP